MSFALSLQQTLKAPLERSQKLELLYSQKEVQYITTCAYRDMLNGLYIHKCIYCIVSTHSTIVILYNSSDTPDKVPWPVLVPSSV